MPHPGRFSPERWQAISALLDQSLELSPGERTTWLAELRAENPELAADVESLLGQREAVSREGFLAGSPDMPPPSLAGHLVGAYTLRSPIGAGGMGNVWLADRSDGRFEGRAAVKLLNLALVSPVGQERFRREGSMLARLAHPGIARLLDAGVSPTGQPYLVLEYVEGRRIDAFAEAKQLTIEDRIGLLLQVLSAVGHAHANLIVHRDLKPSNILVTEDGTAKLLDFGIGKLLETEGAEGLDSLTRDERVLTLQYAAPEQIRGDLVTTATDTHAVGLLLYELVTGRRAWETAGRTYAEIERIVCEQDPVRPSRIARRVGSDLDAIVMKALRKEPARRYPSAQAMEDDLRRFLEGRPVLARPDTAAYRVRKFLGRHRTGAAVVAVLVGLLAGGVVRERALRARAEGEARKAAAVKDYLVSVFEVSDPFGQPDPEGGKATARVLLDRGAARLDASLANSPEAQTDLRGVLGWVYSRLGAYEAGEPLLRRALEEKRARYGTRSLAVADAADKLGAALAELDRLDEAEALLHEALALRRELLGNRHSDTATSLNSLATLLQARNRFDAAEPLFREAVAIRRGIMGDSQLCADSLNNLALLLFLRDRFDEAEPLYREAIAIGVRASGEDHVLHTITRQNLAQVQVVRGQIDEAVGLLRTSLVTKRRILGDSHPSVTIHLNNLGFILASEKGELAEAEALIREALAGDRKTWGERHSFVAESLDNLATVHRLKGDFDEAERTYREVLEMNRSLFGPEHGRVAKNLGNIALTLHMKGDVAGALLLYRESLAMYGRVVGEKHSRYTLVATNLGKALRESGQAAEAADLLRAVSGRLDAANMGQRVAFIKAQLALGRALTDLGRTEEALPMVERALEMSRQRFGERDWRTGEANLAVGACLAASGDPERAEPLLRDALGQLAGQKRAQPTLVRAAEAQLASVGRALGAGGPERVTATR